MEKYYVPEIEEFCVGFEYQILETYGKEKLWSTIYIDHADVFDIEKIEENLGDILPNSYNENDNWVESNIRVKYLDASDIEDVLGVKPTQNENLIRSEITNLEVLVDYYDDDRLLIISKEGIHNVLFEGTIKNKSEFKKILEWTGVAKALQKQRIIDLMKEDERNGRYES